MSESSQERETDAAPSSEAEDWIGELAELSAALRAHAEVQAASGAVGLPRADAAIARERGYDPELWSRAPEPSSAAPKAAAPSRPAAAPSPAPPAASPARPAPAAVAAQPAASPAPRVVEVPVVADVAPIPSLPPEERRMKLDVLAAEVRGCTACRLHEARTQTVFSRGSPSAKLCFVGEGPGADEDAQGEPFVGKAGQLLDKMIEAMGFSRDDVYVCNIVKCRPPNNRKPDGDEMAACRAYLEQQLRVVNPEVIVALGATAVQGLLGTSEGITRLRGRWKLYQGRVAVMPTFHPAYLLRVPRAKRDVWEDLQAVMRQMGLPIPARK